MLDLTADLIDTRDIVARIEEIELDNTDNEGETADYLTWSPDAQKEWTGLSQIIEEVGDEACDGVTLINDGYFAEYTREWYADTWGAEWYQRNERTYREEPVTWDMIMSRLPFSCINWEKVADEVYPDYSQLEIDGTTYLYQA